MSPSKTCSSVCVCVLGFPPNCLAPCLLYSYIIIGLNGAHTHTHTRIHTHTHTHMHKLAKIIIMHFCEEFDQKLHHLQHINGLTEIIDPLKKGLM